jgi:hypothetical protein
VEATARARAPRLGRPWLARRLINRAACTRVRALHSQMLRALLLPGGDDNGGGDGTMPGAEDEEEGEEDEGQERGLPAYELHVAAVRQDGVEVLQPLPAGALRWGKLAAGLGGWGWCSAQSTGWHARACD